MQNCSKLFTWKYSGEMHNKWPLTFTQKLPTKSGNIQYSNVCMGWGEWETLVDSTHYVVKHFHVQCLSQCIPSISSLILLQWNTTRQFTVTWYSIKTTMTVAEVKIMFSNWTLTWRVRRNTSSVHIHVYNINIHTFIKYFLYVCKNVWTIFIHYVFQTQQ